MKRIFLAMFAMILMVLPISAKTISVSDYGTPFEVTAAEKPPDTQTVETETASSNMVAQNYEMRFEINTIQIAATDAEMPQYRRKLGTTNYKPPLGANATKQELRLFGTTYGFKGYAWNTAYSNARCCRNSQ